MSDAHNTRNYFAHGGSELVIGGRLTFLPGASVEGAEGLFDLPGLSAGGGVAQTESQSNDPQRTPPRKSGKTKTGGSSLRTAPDRKPAEAPAEPIITEQEETKNEPS